MKKRIIHLIQRNISVFDTLRYILCNNKFTKAGGLPLFVKPVIEGREVNSSSTGLLVLL
jgi:hypothetical protein